MRSASKGLTHNQLRLMGQAATGEAVLNLDDFSPAEILGLINELGMHQEELDAQNKQMRQTRRKLREARDKFASLYDCAPVGYCTLDAQDRIREANLTLCDMLGQSRKHLLGQTLAAFIPGECLPFYEKHRKSSLISVDKRTCEVAIGSGEARRYVQLDSQTTLDDRMKPQCQTVVTDITERKLLEAEARSLAKFPEENPNPVLRVDRSGSVLYANKPARDVLDECQGPDGTVARHLCGLAAEAMAAGKPLDSELALKGKDHLFSFCPIPEDGYVNIYARDITERKRKNEEALREAESLSRRAQQIAHLGHWRLDLVDNHLWWSDEVYRIFGLIPQEFPATYEAFLDTVHPDDRALVQTAYSSSLKEGHEGYLIDHRIIRKDDGSVRHVQEQCEHERDASGRVVQSIGTVLDITERKWAEARLIEMKDQAEAASQAKSKFLAMMSHELKTPMGQIMGLADLMLDAQPPEDREYLQGIRAAARKLFTLIQNILAFVDLDAIDLLANEDRFETASILAAVEQGVRNAAEAKGLSIRTELDPSLPRLLHGYPGLTLWVLNILADNAVKFTDHGEVVIGASAASPEKDGRIGVEFWVRDTGKGMDEAAMKILFQAFEQGEAVYTRRHGGIGLGLATAQRLAHLIGGHISAQSVLGEGSRFSIRMEVKGCA